MKREYPEFPAIVQGGDIHLDFPAPYREYIKRFEGDEVIVSVWKKRSKRSLKANAALHACLSRWVEEKGEGMLSKRQIADMVELLKDDLLALQFGYVVRQNQFTGEITKTLVEPHTSDLDTQQFCDLFDLSAAEAAKQQHVMVMPDEYKQAREALARKAAREAKKAATRAA